MSYPEIFSARKLLVVLLVSLFSVLAGVKLGDFLGGLLAKPSVSSSGIRAAVTPKPKFGLWVGTVRKVTEFDGDLGESFKLVDEDGAVTALLQSSKIDLSFLEGMRVEAEGRRLKVINDLWPLVLVEKVKFNYPKWKGQ